MGGDSIQILHDSLLVASKTILELKQNREEIGIKILAIIFNWQVLLIVCSFSTLFILRKSIGNFINSFQKAKIEGPSGISISGERNIGNPEEREKESAGVSENNHLERGRNGSLALVASSLNQLSLADLFEDIKNGNLIEARSKLDLLNKNAETDFDRIYNQCLYFYYQFQFAYPNALNALLNLESTTNEPNAKSLIQGILGRCYLLSQMYGNAIKYYSLSINYLEVDSRSTTNLIGIADCLLKQFGKDEAINYLKDKISIITDNSNRSLIFKKAAQIYKEEKDNVRAAISYLKALEFDPNNIDYLFDLGYVLLEAGYPSLSIHYYHILLKFSPYSSSALNNIGVAYKDMEILSKANDYYRMSFKNGESLGAGNLAANYLHSNLFRDAEILLEEAKQMSSVDDKVWAEFENLKRKVKEEDEKEEIIIKQTEWQAKFLKHYSDLFFSNKGILMPDIAGDWILIDGKEYIATWEDNIWSSSYQSVLEKARNKITIVFEKGFGKMTIDVYEKYDFINDSYKGDAVYNSESSSIIFLCTYGSKFISGELKKVVPLSISN